MPGELLKPRSGTLPLKFIIIGGSIAGLAAGYALRMGGHYVEILEQSDGTERVSTSCSVLLASRVLKWDV